MGPHDTNTGKMRVLVAGGGVAAIETVLALHELAGERVAITMLAPNSEFVYRPMAVREPFAYAPAARYPLAAILADVGGRLVQDELGWVEAERRIVHTAHAVELEYDALVLALGARLYPRFRHATTIDDRRMDEAFHGIVQDIEAGYISSVAFIAPGRMAWPLPLYELALMTTARAYDMDVGLRATLITPEDSPLAVFGREVSDGVAALLSERGIDVITSSYAEVPRPGEIAVNPGDRHVYAERIVALPELYGPAVRGLPISEHGFIRVNRFGRVPDVGRVYAAGDAVDFPVKHGGVSAQQADVVAESIAAIAGAEVEGRWFSPEIRGVLLTGEAPRYLHAKITGGHGSASTFSKTPIDGVTHKIAARYLAPYLERLERGAVPA
jgi:sulfide:quinone oxidoreductase